MNLDDDYANAPYIPNSENYLQHWEESAREYRETEHSIGRAQLNLPYGKHPEQVFDLFFPAGRPLGLVVFIHDAYMFLQFDIFYNYINLLLRNI